MATRPFPGASRAAWLLAGLLCLPAASAHADRAALSFSRAEGALRVDVTLAGPTRQHALGSGASRLQASGWTTLGVPADARLDDGAVDATQPFSRYRLRVPADTGQFDRIYAAHLGIGGCGAMIRASAFTSAEAFDVSFERGAGTVVVAPGGGAVAADAPALASGGNRYFYLGDARCVHREAGGVWLYDPAQVPAPLLALVRRSVPAAIERLMQRLDTPLAAVPVIVIDFESRASGFSFRGDVDEAGTILMRLAGNAADPVQGDLAGQIETFLLHEVFHLWNGVAFDQPEGEAQAWLSEGAAEYAALKLRRDLGVLSLPAFFGAMEDRLNRCVPVVAVRPGGIRARDGEGGSLVYDCGAVIQWLGDNLVSDRADFFEVWRALFSEPTYSQHGFLREMRARGADPAGLAMLEWFVGGGARHDAAAIAAGLGDAGVRVSLQASTPRNPEAVKQLLMHLLATNCAQGPYGYTTEPGHLVLDTGDRCGMLSGDPRVSRINGLRIGEQDGEAYHSAQRSCRENGVVSLSHDGQVLQAACREVPGDLLPRLLVEGDAFSPQE